jgi:predicted small secreted protein
MANPTRKYLLIFALILTAVALCGCQTVQGVGRDITWTGQACEQTIDTVIYGTSHQP